MNSAASRMSGIVGAALAAVCIGCHHVAGSPCWVETAGAHAPGQFDQTKAQCTMEANKIVAASGNGALANSQFDACMNAEGYALRTCLQ